MLRRRRAGKGMQRESCLGNAQVSGLFDSSSSSSSSSSRRRLVLSNLQSAMMDGKVRIGLEIQWNVLNRGDGPDAGVHGFLDPPLDSHPEGLTVSCSGHARHSPGGAQPVPSSRNARLCSRQAGPRSQGWPRYPMLAVAPGRVAALHPLTLF